MATSLALSPSTIARGPTPLAIGVTGSGFAANERLSLVIYGEAALSVSADSSGNFVSAIPNPAVNLGCAASVAVTVQSANGPALAILAVT